MRISHGRFNTGIACKFERLVHSVLGTSGFHRLLNSHHRSRRSVWNSRYGGVAWSREQKKENLGGEATGFWREMDAFQASWS